MLRGVSTSRLGVSYTFEVEFAMAIHIVMYASNFGCKRLWLKLDSIYVVTIFWTRSLLVTWRRYSTWIDYLEKLVHMEFYCSHIYRESNIVVDSIASLALVFVQWLNNRMPHHSLGISFIWMLTVNLIIGFDENYFVFPFSICINICSW